MFFLGTYDCSHSIYVTPNKPFEFKVKKYHSIEFNDPDMIHYFLKCYEISSEELERFNTALDIQAYISSIQNKYLCQIEWLNLIGLKHLEDCKHPYNFEFKNYLEALMPEFDRLMDKLENDLATGQNDLTLPVLEITKLLFQKVYFKAHIKDAISDSLIVLSQQGFLTVYNLIQTLLALNIPGNHIILMTKPHTTCRENFEKFQSLARETEIQYISTAEEYLDNVDPNVNYKFFKQKAVDNTVEAIETTLRLSPFHNLIIHDEGGELIQKINFTQAAFSNLRLSTSEHTTCGIQTRLQNQSLNQVPCFNMAGSALKAHLESYFIAEASFEKISKLLDEQIAITQGTVKVAVVGAGGNIGHHFLKLLSNQYQNLIEIIICEKDDKYNELRQQQDISSFQRMDTPAVFSYVDIIFGCTGVDITRNITLQDIGPEHKLTLVSLSSGTREFYTLAQLLSNGNHRVDLRNHGKPIIFDGDKHGIHPLKIQLIRALTMTSIIAQLMYLSMAPKLKQSTQIGNNQSYAHFHDENNVLKVIDGQFQYFILKMYNLMCDRLEHNQHLNVSLKCEFFPKVYQAIQVDMGKPTLKIKHDVVENFNAFAKVDDNHKIHLLQVRSKFYLYLSKHEKMIIDMFMITRILAEVGVNIICFLKMPNYLKLEVLERKFRDFQMSFFSLDNMITDGLEQNIAPRP